MQQEQKTDIEDQTGPATENPQNQQAVTSPSDKYPADTYPSGKQPLAKLKPGLYLVATPIGNLGDLTFRAHNVLMAANVIACEDSRITRRLTQTYGIATPLMSYHEHNAERIRPKIIERINCGEAVALVSDAGTPLISDPGYKLVTAVIDAGLEVTTLPGASAALSALVLSGLPSDRFLFQGFLPPRSAARRTILAELAPIRTSLIFYESARRLGAMLADAHAVLGDRPAAVARELTKKFEEVRRGSLSALSTHYGEAGPPKGEVVVVIGTGDAEAESQAIDLDRALEEALSSQSLRDAVASVTRETGLPKRQVYARALTLAADTSDQG